MTTSKYAINGSHIECSSCLNVFVDPRILPCGHTFCLQCIKGQINANNASSFTCALCRQAWAAPDGVVDNLPKNYSLAAVTSEAQREEEKLVSDSLRGLTLDVNPKFLCSRHPGQTFTVYCKTCKLLACDSCQMTMHRGHACVATDVADAEFKAVIRSVADECSTDIDVHKQFVDKYEAKLIQAKADLQLRERQFEQYKMLLNDTESSYVERAAAVDIVAANQQPTMSQRMTRRWGHDIGPVEPHAGPPHHGRPMQVRPMQDRPMQDHPMQVRLI
jgi:hypothetical protein